MTPRRWNSFVCPGCRMVFRIPRDHDGRGTVCPSCRILLRLPNADAELPPLVAPPPEPVPLAEAPASGISTQPQEAPPWRLIAGLLAGGTALLIAFWLWIRTNSSPSSAQTATSLPYSSAVSAKSPNSAAEMGQIDLNTFNIDQAARQLEPIAKQFLEARSLEDALHFVYKPDVVRQRWTRQLASLNETYSPPGLSSFGENLIVGGNGNFISFTVITNSFEQRPIAFRMLPEGPRVDWESWNGWSEFTWSEIRKQRPTKTFTLRAYLSSSSYYNFSFSEETRWSSYLLEAPDLSEAIYGYVPSSGSLDLEIRPDRGQSRVPILVRVRFPENPLSDNQVLIESVGSMGWIDDSDSP